MRVGFAGTPEFAARALSAIRLRGYTIPLVLTQPDRPSGRGMAVTASAVKRYAALHALHVLQPARLDGGDALTAIRESDLDVIVVAAYGLILPRAVLESPRRGCLNIHASLLPRWRGAAPIARAIEAGDATTGITIMQMDAGLDTGPIVRRQEVAIAERETAGTLHDRLAGVGAALIVAVLDDLARDSRIVSVAQPREGATYAAKIGRAERMIDWSADALALDRKIRALTPAPGAHTSWRGAPFRICVARPVAAATSTPTFAAHGTASAASGATTAAPGEVVAVTREGIDVACGGASRSLLRLVELQPAAGRRMPADAFASGRGIVAGARFDPAAW